MKKIHIFSIVYLLAFILSLNNNGYAKDVSEKDVIKIEKEAQQKELESKRLQAQAIQLNLELSKIDKNIIALAKKIQSNEDLLSDSEKEQKKLSKELAVKEADFIKENSSLIQTVASLQNMSLNPSESIILQPLSPVDIIRSAILLREVIPYLNETSSKLKADLDYIYQQKQKLENTVETAKKQSSDLEK